MKNIKEQTQDDRTTFMGTCMSGGKSMEDCAKEWDAKQTGMQEAEWDTAYINDLPDSAFAVDRKLPHHDNAGNLDKAHLQNALARCNQIEGESKTAAKEHLCKHAKAEGIESEFCGLTEAAYNKVHLFCESIMLEGNKVSGVAIHPKSLWHPPYGGEEAHTDVFLKEELKKAAPTLAGKPFGIDHVHLLPKPNLVEKSWYDEQLGGVAFTGTVDDNIAKRIRQKEFKGLSIELNWFKPGVILEKVDGLAPRNFDFTSVHLMSQCLPADKETYIKMWEGLVLPIVPPPFDVQIDQLRQMFEQRISYLEGQFNAMSRDMMGQVSGSTSPAIIIFKEAKTKINAEIQELKSAVEDLGKLKQAYLLERAAKDGIITQKEKELDKKKSEFDAALMKIAEKLSLPPPKENEVIVAIRKQLFDEKAKTVGLEKRIAESDNEWKDKYVQLHKAFLESIPPPHIWKGWTLGPKRLIAEQLKLLGVAPNDRW